MPRRPRYEITDIPQHVVQRGNNRQATFFRAEDYRQYLDWLREAAAREGCEVHAYALMTNHVHLLVTPRRPMAISRMIQSVGRRYVRHINDAHRRTGTLWEGRHHASLVSTGEYFMTCCRYIELNPVRAGMVCDPSDHPWSSYRRNARSIPDALVTEHGEYMALGRTGEERAAAYRELFKSEVDPALLAQLRQALQESRPFGSERFKDEVEKALGRRVRPGKAGRPTRRARTMGLELPGNPTPTPIKPA
jgi:putative transposase